MNVLYAILAGLAVFAVGFFVIFVWIPWLFRREEERRCQ